MTWFVDKVLPGLVGGAIAFFGLWLFGIGGLISSYVFASIGQAWIPPGTMLLVSEKVGTCPSGWDKIGQLGLLSVPTSVGVNPLSEYFDILTGTDGYNRIIPTVCVMKGGD